MKTKLLWLLLAALSLSCGKSNNALTNAQKEKIQGEIEILLDSMNIALEEGNFDQFSRNWINSPDFYLSNGGGYFTYEESQGFKEFFKTLINQKIEVYSEKYVFLDSRTVLYFSKMKCLSNFKIGLSINQEPWSMQWLFKLVDGEWKVLYGSEHGITSVVKTPEASLGLNQLELVKQFQGTWKLESPNDTVAYYEQNIIGPMLEVKFKFFVKGKFDREGKQLWGYDKSLDKFFFVSTGHKGRTYSYILWFTDKTKYIYVPVQYMGTVWDSREKIVGEYTTPGTCIEKYYLNNEVVRVDTYKRVK